MEKISVAQAMDLLNKNKPMIETAKEHVRRGRLTLPLYEKMLDGLASIGVDVRGYRRELEQISTAYQMLERGKISPINFSLALDGFRKAGYPIGTQ